MSLKKHIIEIEFKDRLGFAYEILEPFEKHLINKSNLEILPQKGKMVVAVKFHCSTDIQFNQVITELATVKGVVSVTSRDYMPYEKKERRLQIILNSVSEGVIAIDEDGTVEHINDMACRIFSCSHDEVINRSAEALFPPESPIFTTLKSGHPFSNKEQRICTANKGIHFFISCIPILDFEGTTNFGVVATIKDYQQVEEITLKLTKKKNVVTFENIIQQNSKMKALIETAKVVAKGTSSILIRGDSGTGKELFAKAIHTESNRCSAPFIAINCGALPDTLLESELFGYEPGTFTGATKSGKKGLFEQATTGTIFLDEIGEVSRQMQVSLLRVLQEHTIRKVGGDKDIPVDVRIIAATNRNLEDMMRQGLFREDLYYRLNVIPLNIPPLRERKEDIQLIAQHLIRKLCLKLGKPEKYLTKESITFLLAFDYPGNVRQLENMLELAVNLEQTEKIQLNHFTDNLNLQPGTALINNNSVISDIKIPAPVNDNWPPLKEIIREVEKQIIVKVMQKNSSSRKAGNVLGVSNTTILKKIKKYGIVFPA
ncbi:MAG: sensor protein [Firmicutes bacterium]|nr:sensor protein [Bacillota bacterium]MBP2638268.1 sensor protein [Bacillota bacterium]